MKLNPTQEQFSAYERGGQLVLAINTEKILSETAPVRLASAQLEELDYRKLYEAYSTKGRKSAADAKVMFEIICYGYQCGIYSNRDLEEACRYRVDFMWLLGDENIPDHCSFARFRKRNAEAIEDLFYQYVNLLEKQGETDHEVCFIDGTKMESRAGRYTFVWRGTTEKSLEKVKAAIRKAVQITERSELRAYLEKKREGILFVHGSGKRKSEAQKEYEKLKDYISHYKCESCVGCPQRAACCSSRDVEQPKLLKVKKQLKEKRAASLANITTEEGILLRMCRSIQVEGAFGLIKNDFGFRRFFSTGKKNVRTERFFLAMGFNLKKRWMKQQNNRERTHLSTIKTA